MFSKNEPREGYREVRLSFITVNDVIRLSE